MAVVVASLTMADLSAEELKAKVFEVLKGVDLASTSAKKVRLQLEEDLKTNLSGRKEELGKIIQVRRRTADAEGGILGARGLTCRFVLFRRRSSTRWTRTIPTAARTTTPRRTRKTKKRRGRPRARTGEARRGRR